MHMRVMDTSVKKSLDEIFRQAPIVLAISIFCTSLQATPVIDFNGNGVWRDTVADGEHFSRLSITDLNPSGDLEKKITIGDGLGTLYFDNKNTDQSLIEFWGKEAPVSLSVKGNVNINNVNVSGGHAIFRGGGTQIFWRLYAREF